MRYITSLLLGVIVGCLASSTGTWAMGKPGGGPITCPPDVALALAEECPCDGKVMPDSSVQPWKNHGKYVSCVVHLRNDLRKAGCLTDEARRSIARCAARSTCGKPGRVLCCVPVETGICSDPAPGDMVVAGTCSNDPAVACDSNAGCTKSEPHLAKDADACAADGGAVLLGGGSVCTTCPPPAP